MTTEIVKKTIDRDIANQILQKTAELTKVLNRRTTVFDPRIIEDETNRTSWCTESIDLANNGIRQGFKLKEYPYLKTVQGAKLRKANLSFTYSDDELFLLEQCIEDKIFLANNFIKLKDGDKGWSNIILREYQESLLEQYRAERFSIIMFPRQSGKTTTTVIEIVHYVISNIDKDLVVIAQSDKVISEILSKLKQAFESLPFFLQPGFISFNKKGFSTENGCRLTIGIASESVVQGYALDFLYIDEFAYIRDSMVRNFWNNIYPTLINNPNSRCIITSTPNGRNMFYELWTNAVLNLNKFSYYRIYWQDVPRDVPLEEFKRDTISNLGLEGWEMAFECSFDTTLKSVFSSAMQKLLRDFQEKYKFEWSVKNHMIGDKYGLEFISNKIKKYDTRKDYFLMSVDIAEGLEIDYSVLKIYKVDWNKEKQCLEYFMVGVYRDNAISVEDFAKLIMDVSKYFDKNKLRIVVENNTYGGELFAHIDSLSFNDVNYRWIDNIVFAKFFRKTKNDYERGIRYSKNKNLAVKSFSYMVNDQVMMCFEPRSIEEQMNFGRQKNGTYSAKYGHDDLVMADVTCSTFVKCGNMYATSYLKEAEKYYREFYDDLDKETMIKKLAELSSANNKYVDENGFSVRDHAKSYEQRQNASSSQLII